MPRRCPTTAELPHLVAAQDFVVSREQALSAGMTPGAIKHRLASGQWRLLLPNVYLTHPGEPSRRQMLMGALLYAGPEAAIDAADACRFHGITAAAIAESCVCVVVPWGCATRSRGYVRVRRTTHHFRVVETSRLRYVDAATAAIAAARSVRQERRVLAILSDAVQRRIATFDELVDAHLRGSRRNAKPADAALEHIGAGVRSAPEADLRRLVQASTTLPPLAFNAWLRLPGGRVVCVDALITSSAVVHEVNGRRAHAREDLFEDMQVRHDALTAAGFVVLHNTPRRIQRQPRSVLAQLEQCHARYDGRGLPLGVTMLDPAAWDGSSRPERPRS